MKPIPAEKIVEGLSEDLQDLLVREAFVRARQQAVATELTAKQAEATAAQAVKPGFSLFRGKEAKAEAEATETKLKEELTRLGKAAANCDVILRKCDKIIGAELERYLETQSPEFLNARAAQKLLPEWEQAVGLYKACLKQFITALGIARNQMSSGYDRKANKFAQGAVEAFDAALAAARTLEAEVAIPNKLAKRYRELLGLDVAPTAVFPDYETPLPYVGGSAMAKNVAALKTATLEVAATRITALLDECEKSYREGIPAMLEELTRVQAVQQANQRRHVSGPLNDIRAMADGLVDAAQMDAVCAAMEARFVTLTG